MINAIRSRTFRASALVAIGLLTGQARAQCDGRWESPDLGVAGLVDAIALWDPDGPGPRGEVLVVGGNFSAIAGVPVNKLAVFDGTTWSPISDDPAATAFTFWHSSFDGGYVYRLGVYRGELIVAGVFDSVGGVPARNIAAWNGSSWRPLAAGLRDQNGFVGTSPYYYSPAQSMTVFQDRLVVAGVLEAVDGQLMTLLAWDGSAWAPLPGAEAQGGRVYGVAAYGDDLIVTGTPLTLDGVSFNGIAAFDGSTWRGLGSGLSSEAYALGVYRGELIVGGAFGTAGDLAARSIATWSGEAWSPMGDGLTWGDSGSVQHLASYGGRLVAGGYFHPPGAPGKFIAQWDGSAWAPLGDGFPIDSEFTVRAMQAYRGRLYVSGHSTRVWPHPSLLAVWVQTTADLTDDGLIDWSDYLHFLWLFDDQDPTADLNGDGLIDWSDYLQFLSLFARGC